MFSADFAAFCDTLHVESKLRLAPTPSGYLHVGNALNFYLNWFAARKAGCRLLLRIDDLDADRKRPEYVTDIFETLAWLKIDWDEGPGLFHSNPSEQVLDFEANWSQHLRRRQSDLLINQLREKGLLFACRKSRSQLATFGGEYPIQFRDQGLSLDDPDVAWRVKVRHLDPGMCDFVVRRRDGLPAYQIASLADDVYFGITHIIRGADLLPSSKAQLFLAEVLELKAFQHIEILHHPLLTDAAGHKLSKSAGAAALNTMRMKGESPESIKQSFLAMIQPSP